MSADVLYSLSITVVLNNTEAIEASVILIHSSSETQQGWKHEETNIDSNCAGTLQRRATKVSLKSLRSENLQDHFFKTLPVSSPQRNGKPETKLLFLYICFHSNHLSDLQSDSERATYAPVPQRNTWSSHVAASLERSCEGRAGGKRNKRWDIWEVEGISKWRAQIRVGWWQGETRGGQDSGGRGWIKVQYCNFLGEFSACDGS